MCIVLLCGRWLDLYQLILPAAGGAPQFGVLEILLAAGYAGLAYLLFARTLGRAPLVPLNDPVLAFDAQDQHRIHILRWVPGIE